MKKHCCTTVKPSKAIETIRANRTARRVSQKPRVVEAQCPCCTIRTWLPGPEAVGGGRQWSG